MNMETEEKTELEIEPTQVETEEQKVKRKVPIYFLIREMVGNSTTHDNLAVFSNKKELKDYLEKTEGIENLNPVLILGHEVPLTFNKVVKVDF